MKKIIKTDRDKEEIKKINYTKESIQNDYFDYSGVIVNKPWGYEYLLFNNKITAAWILHIMPKSSTSLHCHLYKKTSLIVLQGSVVCSTLENEFICNVGNGLIIEKGVFHQTRVEGKEPAVVLELETPVNKRDLVRLKDKYGREGKSYESKEFYSFNNTNYNLIKFDKKRSKYDNKKYFNTCSLNFIQLKNITECEKLINNKNNLSILLSEPIISYDNTISIQPGDNINFRDYSKKDLLSNKKKCEILQIKKNYSEIKVSDFIAAYLKEKKVGLVLLVPGEANIHLVDSVGKCDGLPYYTMDSERGASFAGEGFSKAKREVSIIVVSSGNSALGVIQGVANAWVDSVPLIILSGQGHTGEKKEGFIRQQSNKSIDVVPIVNNITKYSVRVDNPKEIYKCLEIAFFESLNDRPGPVWIDLPIDIQGALIKNLELKRLKLTNNINYDASKQLAIKIQALIELLKDAKKPVLLVGDGARNIENQLLIELVDKLGIPVLTSRRGADLIPETNLYYYGRPGAYGQRSANFILQNSDLLICLGTRLTTSLTGRNTKLFAVKAKKVVVDIDINELTKHPFKIHLAIHTDSKTFIKFFHNALSGYKNFLNEKWIIQCKNWTNNFPRGSYGGLSLSPKFTDNEKIYPLNLIRLLSSLLDKNITLVVDGGAPLIYVTQAFEFKYEQRFICSTGLELPGSALSVAFGVSLANKNRTVVCICEDHGLINSIQELRSYLEMNISVKIIVLKSKGQSIIRNIQNQYFGGRIIGTNRLKDSGTGSILEIARLFGFLIFEVNSINHIEDKLKEMMVEKHPSLITVDIADDHSILPRPGFTVLDDLTWEPKSLEDMYPFVKKYIFTDQTFIK